MKLKFKPSFASSINYLEVDTSQCKPIGNQFSLRICKTCRKFFSLRQLKGINRNSCCPHCKTLIGYI